MQKGTFRDTLGTCPNHPQPPCQTCTFRNPGGVQTVHNGRTHASWRYRAGWCTPTNSA